MGQIAPDWSPTQNAGNWAESGKIVDFFREETVLIAFEP